MAKTKTTKTTKTKKAQDEKAAGAPVLVRGRTLSDIARGTGLTPSYVSRLHRGKRLPSLTALDAIAKFLGCTPEEARAEFATAPPPEGKRGAGKKEKEKKAKPQAKEARAKKAKAKSSKPRARKPANDEGGPLDGRKPTPEQADAARSSLTIVD